MKMQDNKLNVKCPSFSEQGEIPKIHTGFDKDISPEFLIDGLTNDVKTIAIIMDDLDIRFIKSLPHWVIWNLPPESHIAENIPYGAECSNGAKQGLAFGKNRYRGPKQPPFIKKAHRYRFTVYALDCILALPTTSKKSDLMTAISGHILQTGEVIGWYKP